MKFLLLKFSVLIVAIMSLTSSVSLANCVKSWATDVYGDIYWNRGKAKHYCWSHSPAKKKMQDLTYYIALHEKLSSAQNLNCRDINATDSQVLDGNQVLLTITEICRGSSSVHEGTRMCRVYDIIEPK